MRPLIVLLLFSASAFAAPPGPQPQAKKVEAKSAKPVEVKPKVEKADPLDDLRLKNALLESQLARAAWEMMALQLAVKYHLDPATDGWDPQTLVIHRKEKGK
jgi:hypothetical protein